MPAATRSEPDRAIRAASDAAPGGDIGVARGTALYVAAAIGPGILVLPGLAVDRAGPAALIALAAVLALSAPIALTFAALAARFPDAGGVSTFAARALGRRAATVTAWWFYFGVPVGVPALGLFAGAYVEAATGGGRPVQVVTAVAIIAVALVVNLFGARLSGGVQLALSALLVAALVAVIAYAAWRVDPANFTPFAPKGLAALGPAALLLVWSFTGWEAVTHLAGEFRRPGRDIARATRRALVIVAGLFMGVTAALVAAAGPAAGAGEAPMAEVLSAGAGRAGVAAAAVLAVLISFGSVNVYLASLAKLGAAMGRDGSAPRWLGRGAAPGDIPRRSLLVVGVMTGAVMAGVSAGGWSTADLVLLCTASQLAVYAVGLLAALQLLDRASPSWWAALVALAAVGALLIVCGSFLIAPVVLATMALVWTRRGAACR